MQKELIKLLSEREKYEKYMQYIHPTQVSEETFTLLKDIGKYFEINPESTEVNFSEFSTWFNIVQHQTLKDEKRQLFNKVLEDLPDLEVSKELRHSIVSKFQLDDCYAHVADIVNRGLEGDSRASVAEIREVLDQYEHEALKVQQKASYELEWDIQDIVESTSGKGGLRWRLPALNQSCGPIGKGDLIIVAKRPDSGGTTLTISEFTHMAAQLPEGQVAVWVNNEERGKKVQSRIIQSTVGCTKEELQRDKLTVFEVYTRIQGDERRIRFLDDSDPKKPLTMQEIERYLESIKDKIGLLVIDQLWKVPVPGRDTSDVGTQTVIANHARHLAKTYCPVIGIYQLGTSAEGVKYPKMSDLYFSGTAVQGEADLIIMLGRSHEPYMEKVRFLSFPKHKLSSPDNEEMRNSQHEIIMKPEICRFVSADTDEA